MKNNELEQVKSNIIEQLTDNEQLKSTINLYRATVGILIISVVTLALALYHMDSLFGHCMEMMK